jgi:hypothetical protein
MTGPDIQRPKSPQKKTGIKPSRNLCMRLNGQVQVYRFAISKEKFQVGSKTRQTKTFVFCYSSPTSIIIIRGQFNSKKLPF